MNLLHFLFPPLCLACKEPCSSRYLCPSCWQLAALPDPIERCRQCFDSLENRTALCQRCRTQKGLFTIQAHVFDPSSPAVSLGYEPPLPLAAFAFYQWVQLEWDMPDLLIPMPDSHSIAIGAHLAQLIGAPLHKALRSHHLYTDESLPEDATLLLFSASNPPDWIETAARSLLSAFPQKIYVLHLHPYAYFSL